LSDIFFCSCVNIGVLGPTLSNTVSFQRFRDYLLDPIIIDTTAPPSVGGQPALNTKNVQQVGGSTQNTSQTPAELVGTSAEEASRSYNYWAPPSGLPDLSIMWDKLTEHFRTNDAMRSISAANKSGKLSNSRSLEALATTKQVSSSVDTANTSATQTANALALASTKSVSPRGTQSNIQINFAAMQASAKSRLNQQVLLSGLLSPELLSFCKTMLLKAEPYMSDVDYLKLCDSFELERTLTQPELQLLVRTFWTNISGIAATAAPLGQSAVSAGYPNKTSASAAAAPGKQPRLSMKSGKQTTGKTTNVTGSVADLEGLLAYKQLSKVDYLLWLLDLEPLLVFVNFISFISYEFGGNRGLAVRSFVEILGQSLDNDFSETEFLGFLNTKLGLKIDILSLFGIAIRTIFLKLGRVTRNVVVDIVALMHYRVFVEYLTMASETASEDVSLLSVQYQNEPPALGSGGPNSSGSSQLSRLNTANSEKSDSTIASRLNSADAFGPGTAKSGDGFFSRQPSDANGTAFQMSNSTLLSVSEETDPGASNGLGLLLNVKAVEQLQSAPEEGGIGSKCTVGGGPSISPAKPGGPSSSGKFPSIQKGAGYSRASSVSGRGPSFDFDPEHGTTSGAAPAATLTLKGSTAVPIKLPSWRTITSASLGERPNEGPFVVKEGDPRTPVKESPTKLAVAFPSFAVKQQQPLVNELNTMIPTADTPILSIDNLSTEASVPVESLLQGIAVEGNLGLQDSQSAPEKE
jgi:hypothetical protein